MKITWTDLLLALGCISIIGIAVVLCTKPKEKPEHRESQFCDHAFYLDGTALDCAK